MSFSISKFDQSLGKPGNILDCTELCSLIAVLTSLSNDVFCHISLKTVFLPT